MLRLLGETSELPVATGEREKHLLDGLTELLGAPCGMIFHLENFSRAKLPLKGLASYEEGMDDGQLAILGAYMLQDDPHDPLHLPMADAFDALVPGDVLAQRRQEILPDNQWYRTEHVGEMRKAIDLDSCLFASLKLDTEGRATVLALHRTWSDRPFGVRERLLAELIWAEAGRLVPYVAPGLGAHVYHEGVEPSAMCRVPLLPPRMRQVLGGILHGLAAGEIARHLGLSTHTVRDHIKRLHKRFGTSSQPELIALCSGRDPRTSSPVLDLDLPRTKR